MNVFYNPKSKNTYLVPDHYGRSLFYIKTTLEWAKQNGLSIPKDDRITFEVLRGDRYARMLCIEFESETEPTCDYTDLDKYPHMYSLLMY